MSEYKHKKQLLLPLNTCMHTNKGKLQKHTIRRKTSSKSICFNIIRHISSASGNMQ